MDRGVGLPLGNEGTGDARLSGSARTALYLNEAMARNAGRYIFHHPKDDPPSASSPQRRAHEI
jgi:hypothetical protein